MDIPNPTTPAYELPAPNERLVMYDGAATYNGRRGHAVVGFDLHPRVDIKATFTDADEHGALRTLAEGSAGRTGRLALDEIAMTMDVLCTHWSTAGDTTLIAREAVSVGGADAPISRVVVHLLNYHGQLCGEGLTEASPDEDYGNVWSGRNTLDASGWHITIDARPGHTDIIRTLEADGGYGFTHVAEVSRADGGTFTPGEAADMLWCFAGLLSFARGAWVAPVLPVGYAFSGDVVWRRWSQSRCSEWHRPQSWLDPNHQGDLAQVAPGFFESWYRGGCWQESVWRAVLLYLEANASDGRHPGMIETRVILAQAGLELLAWVLLDDGCNQPVGAEVQPSGNAADHIRALLTRAGIPLTPGADLLWALNRFRDDVGAEDAAHAATKLRNRFTHPRRRAGHYTADTEALVDCWRLAMWWLQLILLQEFGYSGGYIPHLRAGGWRQRVPVPWAHQE